jgi:AraC-like DNA-binding protein
MAPKTNTMLRQWYNPVQPSIKQATENVVYQEFLPDNELLSFIYCYWQLRTTQRLEENFVYRVVADGCIDIFFELENPSNSFVMGFCKQYTEFALKNTFNYLGIRFLPTAFPQIFKINASELSNRFEELEIVAPSIAQFIKNHLHTSLSTEQIKNLLDEYLLALLSKTEFDNDARLYNAIDLILKHAGVIDIEKDLDTGISPRQLRRLFEFYIGDTPKTFSQVVRFQGILRAKPSVQSLRKNKLFFDVGYYDQAHFIKEFKNFYGVTPTQAFGREES